VSDGEAAIRAIWQLWNDGEHVYNPEFVDPEIEVRSALTGQLFSGPAELERWAAEIDDQFEEWRLVIGTIEDLGDDRYVVRGSVRARGRNSGIDLDQAVTWNVQLRDGRLLRLQNVIG
jgi:hypothetical protein